MLDNPFRKRGLTHAALEAMPWPSTDVAGPTHLLTHCPAAHVTPLVQSEPLARAAGCAEFWIKDERGRMGLGSFKALGAAYAIAAEVPVEAHSAYANALAGRVFVTASAGNHGLSVAVGARIFGARAVIFIAENVPEAFARLLESKGAEVMRVGATYEHSMAAAEEAAWNNGWSLLSDSSWVGYSAPAQSVMEGYTVLAREIADHIPRPPTVVLLQAGVGGLAASAAAYLRSVWGDDPRMIVVEPEAAPALHNSIRAAAPVVTEGPVSNMGRLDCKTPSLIALKGLSRDADGYALIDDATVQRTLGVLAEAGFATSPSGGAGACAALSGAVPITPEDRVLCILSEGPV